MKEPLPVERITLKKIGENILNVFNLEKGIGYTLRELLLRPGKAVDDFLFTEKRTLFIKPLSLLLLVTGLVLFILLKVALPTLAPNMEAKVPDGLPVFWKELLMVATEKIQEYGSAVQLAGVPTLAICSFWFFGSKIYNLAEHLVIAAYVASIMTLLSLLLLPFMFYDVNIGAAMSPVTFLYFLYAYIDIFKASGWMGLAKILGVSIGSWLLQMVVFILIFAIYFLVYPV